MRRTKKQLLCKVSVYNQFPIAYLIVISCICQWLEMFQCFKGRLGIRGQMGEGKKKLVCNVTIYDQFSVAFLLAVSCICQWLVKFHWGLFHHFCCDNDMQ